MLVYQRVSLYSVYSLSIAPTNPPAKVGHSTTQSPPLIAAWWFQLVDVGRSPRVWCLKSTRFWFPLPTSRISGLAVDLSFSCHPRHRSCGRPVVSSQKMIKMVTWSGIPWKKVIRSNWIHAGMVANHSLLSGFLLWPRTWMMWALPIPFFSCYITIIDG